MIVKTGNKRLPILLLISLMLAILMLVPGCRPSNTLNIAGSTTVQPLAEKLAAAYMTKHPGITVTVTGGGSSTGITSVANGIVEIGTSSRQLMANEAEVLTQYKIAIDGIAFIVHPSLNVNALTTAQVVAILTGQITNWSQVNGPDLHIDVVTREAGSGTRDTIETQVLQGGLIVDNALQQPSNGALRSTIAGLKSSFGYLSIPYIDSSVKGIVLDGVIPTPDNVKNETYPLIRPLLMLTRGQAKGMAKDFIDFCLGPDGQQIVDAEGYSRID